MPTGRKAAESSDAQAQGKPESFFDKVKKVFLGPPKTLEGGDLFHNIALVPFLAWVGLGADGLSSSSYGPEEAFRALGQHTYLAIGLALLTSITVLLISAAYSQIIEAFPHGGGGYVVATALLGERVGVVSGCALLVDYVLTITVSLAAAGDALFSFLPPEMHGGKLLFEAMLVVMLTTVNMRGTRESVMAMMPIFLVFLATHILMIGGGILVKAPTMAATAREMATDFKSGVDTIGIPAMLLLFVRAYSLGGGTYTGIEAVSNGLPIMREPRAETAKRTMIYMAVSLAVCAGGLFLCYLLWHVEPVPGKTLNAVLIDRLVEHIPYGHVIAVITLVSEGALLVVAAQAGFIDGPRVLANMAIDSWAPRRFAQLSERLTTQNGILLMGVTSLAALLYTAGDVRYLVVMYSINVFVTFSLSMFGMARATINHRNDGPPWKRKAALFVVSFLFCATILAITVAEKFGEGGWITLVVTFAVIMLCYMIKAHYNDTGVRLATLYDELHNIPMPETPPNVSLALNRAHPTAVVLVASFGGLGIHTFLNVFRHFPGYFKNVVFVSVGIIDSGEFKGEDSLEKLKERTASMLDKYTEYANSLGIPAHSAYTVGTDAVDEAEKVCREVAADFEHVVFFAGKVVFETERWYHSFLHNETAVSLQKRLQWSNMAMSILPARVR